MEKIIYLILFFVSFIMNSAFAQVSWEAPADESNRQNPLEATPDNINHGKALYSVNCKSCHGDPGKHNGLHLPPVNPPDLTAEHVQANTAGALFYFIETGKLAMPSFKAILLADDRWKLVLYIKSLGSQTETGTAQSKDKINLQGKAELKVTINTKEEKIIATLNDVVDSVSSPLAGVRIDFFIKRYFGNLKIGAVKTDNTGTACIDYPEDIPGDSTGCVTLIVKADTNACSAESLIKNAPVCSVHYVTGIFTKRVMWSENDKTQWWVILSYLGVVLGVWLTIFYVVSLIGKINKLGKE